MAHRDGVNRADLGAKTAEETATSAQNEFAQLTVAFFRGDDVHLETGRGADSGAKTTCDAERLACLRVGSQRRQATISWRHVPFFFWIADGHVRLEEPLERNLETFDFVKHFGAPAWFAIDR